MLFKELPDHLQAMALYKVNAADVPEEDRKALLGHTDGSITSHYSAAELTKPSMQIASRQPTRAVRR